VLHGGVKVPCVADDVMEVSRCHVLQVPCVAGDVTCVADEGIMPCLAHAAVISHPCAVSCHTHVPCHVIPMCRVISHPCAVSCRTHVPCHVTSMCRVMPRISECGVMAGMSMCGVMPRTSRLIGESRSDVMGHVTYGRVM